MLTEIELKKIISDLEKIKGRHTELVTLYIPAGYNINEISSFLTIERNEASNIKSKSTRKNVQSALERIQRRIKDINKLPENGLAFFSGNISQDESKVNIQLWEIEPPHKIVSRIYRCDKEFVLEPLREMLKEKKFYGIISIDRSEAVIGIAKSKGIEILAKIESQVPGKQSAGGQSQMRFARIREGLYHSFLKEVADKAMNLLMAKIKDEELMGIILSGPGYAKDDLADKNYLNEELKKKIVARINTGYAGEDGLREVEAEIPRIMKEAEISKEKIALQKFLENLGKENGLSIYGLDNVLKAVEMGVAEKVLVHGKVRMDFIKIKCAKCGNLKFTHKEKPEDYLNLNCEKCGSKMHVEEIESLLDYIEEKAGITDAEVIIISSEMEEGRIFLNLGGIGAILRYKFSGS